MPNIYRMLNDNNQEALQKIYVVIFSFVVISMLILSGIFVYIYNHDFDDSTKELFTKEITIENINECQNLSFQNQVECMIEYVKPYYNYNIRWDVNRSIEDVLINGGDCYDWSHVYAKLGNQLGLNTRTENIYGNKIGHTFVIIWDKDLTGYCIVDGLKLSCGG